MLIKQFDLHGKTALVTGADQGIGRAIALALGEQGASIAIHFLDHIEWAKEVAALITANGGKTCLIEMDLGLAGAARRLFDQTVANFNQVDILVLNVSIQIQRNWLDITPEDVDKQVAVNFKSEMELMQLAVPGMVERGWGRILNIGSVQQALPYPEMLVYAATKEAQFSMVRNLARQVGKFGVTVNTLAPGIIDTPRNQAGLHDPEELAKALSSIPAGFIGQPQDCAGAALLLCSDAGRYINGVCLYVDGAMHLSTSNL